MTSINTPGGGDFIRRIVREDVAAGRNGAAVVTRFPPEPNGYLHIGHAKSICLNFGIAEEFSNGRCYLRFDDTNPEKESIDYVNAIKEDVRWLGYDWEDRLTHASDYFETLYDYAIDLIRADRAYVCDLSADEIRATRGTLTEPGTESPGRHRGIDENLDLFRRMRAGGFEDGSYVLRLKIDMASPNLNLRDPVIYRIRRLPHQMTGDAWCIYPMYDYTHCISDALEGITHSLCTLEFEDHRPLYDWILDHLDVPCHPRQIEFSRLELEYTIVSKRALNTLVRDGHVDGWDDPRMPTLSALRRRGCPPAAIRDFCSRIGVTKKDNRVEMGVLENSIREALDPVAPRRMAVLDPLKVVIENYPADREETFDAPNHPARPDHGTRPVRFSRTIYIERDDFREDPPKKFFRLAPGREVRLRFAYFITCEKVVRDPEGRVMELRCRYDPETRGGVTPPDGRKVKGTIHWVSAAHAIEAEVRLYDRLFRHPVVSMDDLPGQLNPESLVVRSEAKLEAGLADAAVGDNYQFERLGYFCLDHRPGETGGPVYNRTATLRDTWAKVATKQ